MNKDIMINHKLYFFLQKKNTILVYTKNTSY